MSTQRPILIVEDNPDIAESLAAFLEIAGYQALIAQEGHAGVQAAVTQCPAAILCDIGLPGISGYEVAKRLRQLNQFRTLPMVAITGYSQYADRQQALAAGFDEHMTKPVDLDRLMSFLETRLAPPPSQVNA